MRALFYFANFASAMEGKRGEIRIRRETVVYRAETTGAFKRNKISHGLYKT